MATKKQTVYEMNLVKLISDFRSEEKCRDYLESLRWPQGVCCPRCQSRKISRIVARGQFDCDSCRYQFSVTSGTVMHDTHLPLWKWFLAIYMIVESKKGISANQLKRTLEVSYRTAWYLCHRIRKAMETPEGLLGGIVEIDETWIGGKTRGAKGPGGPRRNKTMVVGAVQRDGTLRCEAMPGDKSIRSESIGQFIRENIDTIAKVYTDEAHAYRKALKSHAGHESVNHGADEWVRGDVHTNSIEGAWGLFKRSIIGAYHQISVKHLDAYLDEFEFRFNNRDNPHIFRDALRLLLASGNVEYSELVA